VKRLPRIQFLFAVLSWLPGISVAQTKDDAERWLLELNRPYIDSVIITERIWREWESKPADFCVHAIELLRKEAGDASLSLTAKLEILEGYVAFRNGPYGEKRSFGDWYKAALQKATELGDEHLLQAGCYYWGRHCLVLGDYETGLFYWIKGIELAEKLGFTERVIDGAKTMATSSLYTTHNYEAAIGYCNDILQHSPRVSLADQVGVYNNLGLCLRATGKYDSAYYNFSKAAEAAQSLRLGVWVGIARGNMGDVLNLQNRPEQAMPLWQQDIDSCLKYGERDNAGLTMAFMSEYLFNKGERSKGLALLQKAQGYSGWRAGDRIILLRIKSGFFATLKQYDSALLFLDQYHRLNDSMNTLISRSNYKQLKLRLDFDNNTNQYKLIRNEKQAETTRRNFLLAALVAVLITGWLLLNRQRLKYKLAVQQKHIAESEARSARDQLHLFTQTLLEKNRQIDQLSRQLDDIQRTSDNELISQTILTDEDWNRFRELFEKAHPGFFDQLKRKAPDITTAEIRLAALLKLNLDNKQMASMQGISLSSLRGNKTRLRQRLNIAVEDGLEEFIRNL